MARSSASAEHSSHSPKENVFPGQGTRELLLLYDDPCCILIIPALPKLRRCELEALLEATFCPRVVRSESPVMGCFLPLVT